MQHSIVIGKGAISKYVSGGCQRRLRLDLFAGASARAAAGAVDKDTRRPGAEYLKEQGRVFERSCFQDLIDAFRANVIHGPIKAFEEGEQTAFDVLPLERGLRDMRPGQLLIEAAFDVPAAFAAMHGLDRLGDGRNRLGQNRPDLIFSVPADYPLKGSDPAALRRVIHADGSITEDSSDRQALLAVDIKLSADPSPSQFAELAYYCMTLASWLEENGLQDRFVVLADAMIWSGRPGGSSLRTFLGQMAGSYQVPTVRDFLGAWFVDLEPMPAEVMLDRLLRVLHVDIPQVVATPSWRDLPIHVTPRCSGCDYLGFEWELPTRDTEVAPPPTKDPRYCWPTAQNTSSLSRIPGMTEGAAGKLRELGIETVEAFADLELDSAVFEQHQGLRASREMLSARAAALAGGRDIGLSEQAGSAVIPRFSDLRVALSVDFDTASKQAFALGYEIVAAVPVGTSEVPEWRGSIVRKAEFAGHQKLIMRPGLEPERRAFGQFLESLQDEILRLSQRVEQGYLSVGQSERKPTIQIYIWNQATFEQFRTMTMRHVAYMPQAGATGISPFAWLFPPDTLVRDAETAGRRSPVTIVNQAINLLALAIPFHYPHLEVANAYRHLRPGANRVPYEYRVGHAFSDPLSDQIPSERGHELWSGKPVRAGELIDDYADRLKKAVRMRLQATLSIARKLAHDLNERLVAKAPAVDAIFAPTKPLFGVANDLQVIYQHQRLMAASAEVDVDITMAMSPSEREARYRAIRLEGTLTGQQRVDALAGLDCGGADPRRILVFRMSANSRDAAFKEGDSSISLMPELRLEMHPWLLAKAYEVFPALAAAYQVDNGSEFRSTVGQHAGAKILSIDPRELTIVVLVSDFFVTMVELGIFVLPTGPENRAIIDGMHRDMFVRRRLKPALETIGTPPITQDRKLVQSNISRVSLRDMRISPATPVDRLIWDAHQLANTASGRSLANALPGVMMGGRKPLDRQMEAIKNAVENRLSLLWGPPGTGKSATALGMLIGLLYEAHIRGAAVRIAITGPTWVAIDNVAKKLPEAMKDLPTGAPAFLARLLSSGSARDGIPAELLAAVVETDPTADRMDTLRESLEQKRRSVIVAGTSSQLAGLAQIVGPGFTQLFDFMLVDEASQMDVANAIVAFSTLAEGASVTIVGDDKQMPPVHGVEPPVGHEHIVGSIFDFYAKYQVNGQSLPVRPTMLDTNFRSNAEIVDFFAHAGYTNLRAHNVGQRMGLSQTLGERPFDWPSALVWSPDYGRILDPERPLVSIIHREKYSSQRNDEEASMVAALVATLRGRLAPIGGRTAFDDEALFEHGVGVVTPHRAQRAAVIDALGKALDLSGGAYRKMASSVDTVERFQGQERVVMVCSFGMADASAIASEEDFLFSLNRFNVIVSRAMAKMVVVMSRRMADHLPSDLEVLRQSRLLKRFTGASWAGSVEQMVLPYVGPSDIAS